MEENLRLYSTMLRFLGTKLQFGDIRLHCTYAWMVVGVLLSGRIQVSEWALYRVSPAQAAGRERQISRWLHNERIVPAVHYAPLIRNALAAWSEETLTVALDTSQLWHRFVIVRLALLYRGRSLPLAWRVYKHSSASVAFDKYAPLLPTAAQLIPAGCQVTLLADRGFADVALMRLAQSLGWHFILRTKQSFWVQLPGRQRTKAGRLLPGKGQVRLLHRVRITDQHFGPVHLALTRVPTQGTPDPWILVSDQPTTPATFDHYARRFAIEESFLDDKSAAFDIEQSHLRNAAALSRLLLILATATLYLVSTGTAVVSLHRRTWVDSHRQRGLSYLKLGWRYLKRALALGDQLLTQPWLDAEPDPAPSSSTRRQDYAPTRVLATFFSSA